MTRADQEFERAREALKAAGFSNSACVELLCKRLDVKDRYAMAALQGLLAVDWDATDQEIVDKAFTCADLAMKARTTVRDSERTA